MRYLKSLIEHPLTRGMELDTVETSERRRSLIKQKRLLRRIYEEWYNMILKHLPPQHDGGILELGSGGGFLHERLPSLITSDILPIRHLAVVADAHQLPFVANSLKAIVMIDVLHHLCRVRHFFSEATRCVLNGGRILMVEPWVTNWSRLIYGRFHHEPFNPESSEWEFPCSGPLAGANGALPWIVFQRDRVDFEREFPMWRIVKVSPHRPFLYLVSGGCSLRSFAPGSLFNVLAYAEMMMRPIMSRVAMFCFIVLEKTEQQGHSNESHV
jgi:SAM-dependent methyltransferase